jgi:predicted MPP superfamily phosphohydrolase
VHYFIFVIFFALVAGDVAAWLLASRRLGAMRGLRWRLLHVFWHLFITGMLFYPVALLVLSIAGVADARRKMDFVPAPLVAAVFTWHLFVLPLTLIGWLLGGFAAMGRVLWSRSRRRPVLASAASGQRGGASGEQAATEQRGPTRRSVLIAGAVALPPLLTIGLTTWGARTSGHIRIRSIEVPVPGLPAGLSGFTIAHVTDTHVGKWTSGPLLREISELTNSIKPDMVAFTGDLIDFSIDDLPEGLEMLRRIKSPLFLCEGNHDLIDDPLRFRRETRQAGLKLLTGDSAFMEARGHSLQIMGVPWARSEMLMRDNAHLAARFVAPGAFPILLAHHPHTFDYAAGLPLILSGHTHGGQLMLTSDFGAGNMFFRYLSGVYRKAEGTLVVSNGAGNWYPLRINAPAEILRLTLRPAPTPAEA